MADESKVVTTEELVEAIESLQPYIHFVEQIREIKRAKAVPSFIITNGKRRYRFVSGSWFFGHLEDPDTGAIICSPSILSNLPAQPEKWWAE